MAWASLRILATWIPAEMSCRMLRSSLSGRDWCFAACRISSEFSRMVTNCLIWPLYSTRAGMRRFVARRLSKYTHSVLQRFVSAHILRSTRVGGYVPLPILWPLDRTHVLCQRDGELVLCYKVICALRQTVVD